MKSDSDVVTTKRVHVKVDLSTRRVVVGLTVAMLDPVTDLWTVLEFALDQGSKWVFVPEGESYPDECYLPIAHIRQEIETIELSPAVGIGVDGVRTSVD